MSRWLRVGLALLLAVAALAGPARAASCASPDLCYSGNQTIHDTVVVATAGVTVASGAHLVLDHSDLVFRGGSPHTITIEAGGVLTLQQGSIAVDGTLANIALSGRLEGSGAIRLGAGSFHVLDGGLLVLSASQAGFGTLVIDGAGAAVASATAFTGGSSASTVAGSMNVDGGNWTSVGDLSVPGALTAHSWSAARTDLKCPGGHVELDDARLVPSGQGMALAACTLDVNRTTVLGSVAGASGSVLRGTDLTVSDPLAAGLDWSGGAIQVARGHLTGSPMAVRLQDGARASLRDADLRSTTGPALACSESSVDLAGGSWSGTGASTLSMCDGTLADLALASPGRALAWSVLDGSGDSGGRLLGLAGLSYNDTGSVGDVAFSLAGPGSVTGLAARPQAATTLLAWDGSGAGSKLVDGMALASGSLLADLHGPGPFQVEHAEAGALVGTGLRLQDATVAVGNSTLRAVHPLDLRRADARLFNTFLDAAAISDDHHSQVIASRLLAPMASYRNLAPAPGATIQVSQLDGTVLATGTADATGHAAGVVTPVFTLTATDGLVGAPDLKAKAVLGTLQNETRVPAGLAEPRVILFDATPPSDLAHLRRLSAANQQGLELAWDTATDDHLPPTYEVSLRSVPGLLALFPNGTRAALGPVILTTAGTSMRVDLPAQGAFRVMVTPVDRSGNRGGSQEIQVTWDTQAPTLAPRLAGPEGQPGWYRGAVTVQAGASDALSGIAATKVLIDGVAGNSTNVEGDHVALVEATDAAGNTANATVAFAIDRTAPTPPSLSFSGNRTRQAGLVQLDVGSGVLDDRSGVVEVRIVRTVAGSESVVERLAPPFGQQATVPLLDGENAFVAEAQDAAGNTARSAAIRITVDLAGPTPVGTLPAAVPKGTIVLSFTDPAGVALLTLLDGDRVVATGNSATLQATVPADATHLHVVAVDALGNAADYPLQAGAAKASPWPTVALMGVGLLLAAGARRETL